ncbi:zinc finger BED domain-containing protein 1-like [Rhagoletis pomonella]|uniref:zinc finger BED domain-containing protein 1-like n=1 Tax=Rhagoletis pomonella TaxID=28610 RepID=UPI00177C70BD|nr:zinc finger BED domain-containing protein 1-like [Rhagoletis pomonella]
MAPKRSSDIWNFYNKIENKKLECRECKKTFADFGNTTNLLKHFRKVHSLIYLTCIEKTRKQDQSQNNNLDLDSVTSSSQSLEARVDNENGDQAQGEGAQSRRRPLQMTFLSKEAAQVNSRNVNRELVNMICVDLQPLSIVEDEGFRNYTYQLNPNYSLPSRKMLAEKLLPQQYDVSKAALIEMLQQVDFVAGTTDLWTSDSNKNYLTLTIHFIYQGQAESRVLATKEMTESHTSENIASLLRQVLEEEWKIFDKVVCITTDNASNMKKAVIEILQKRHHSCVAHTLNLTVSDCMKDNEQLSLLTGKCREIVTYFKRSNVASYKLQEIQEQMNLEKLKLQQDVQTRWNSTFIMFDRLDRVKIPLSAALSSLPSSPYNLTSEEWNVLQECVIILRPVEQLTTILSGQQYPTLSCVIPLIRGVQSSLKSYSMSTNIAISLQNKLIETIERRLGVYETNKTAAKATFLDPRFKKAGFGKERNAESVQSWVIEELTCHEHESFTASEFPSSYSTAQLQHLSSDAQVSPNSNQHLQRQTGANDSANDLLWNYLDKKVQQQSNMATPTSSAIVKVKQYVQLPYLQRNMDPCEFWESRKIISKGLYKMSQKYLCIPATSVPSERVFSTAGLLCNNRRNRLEPKKVDQILFLNSHRKNKKVYKNPI